MQPPEIQYARSGDVAIAYQVLGDGPIDLVFVAFMGNLAYMWEQPLFVEFYERLASFSRLILFDKRGTGLSDRPRDLATLETRMDDVRAVMDAVGAERASLLGTLEGGHVTAVFAATYPERTSALVLFNTVARFTAAPGYPWGFTEEDWQRRLRDARENWGTREYLARHLAEFGPSLVGDEDIFRWFATYYRLSASPGAAYAFYRMVVETDIRDVLPAIRVPTLCLYRRPLREPARYVAEQIPHAQAVEVPGEDFWIVTDGGVTEEVERFLTGAPQEVEPNRVLATVLFTDIVGSTERAAALGDRAWNELRERHHAVIRQHLARFRGEELATAGDGFLSTFDGPARAIRCACAVRDAVRPLGLEIRAGLHTGECEIVAGEIGGIAVHIGARVAAAAGPGEVVVSSTVKDLVAGSGLEFAERGEHELKGVPGRWRLYAVAG